MNPRLVIRRVATALTCAWLALSTVDSARAQADDELDDLGSDATSGTTDSEREQPARQATGDDAADDSAESDAAPAPEADAEPATASEPQQQPPAASVAIQPFVGAGWTSRSFTRPTRLGAQRLPTAYAPAVEVGLRVVAWPSDPFSLVVLLHYQSAIGFEVTEFPPFALENKLSVRVERAELSVAPRWRLGGGARAAQLSVPIGMNIRTFFPSAHNFMTPGYSLMGPQLRVAVDLPLASALTLSIAPEGQWIMAIDDTLTREGVQGQGFALGGVAGLYLLLNDVWALALEYRESHALVAGSASSSFEDTERYMTVRAQGTF